MAELELKVDPEFVEKFKSLGGALVKLGDMIERLDSLLRDMTPVTDSLQSFMTDISADLNIATTPGRASRATRADVAERAALSAASIFYVVSQVPGILPLVSEMSSLGDFSSLTPEQRRRLAERLREEGGKLERLPVPDVVKSVPIHKASGRAASKKPKN